MLSKASLILMISSAFMLNAAEVKIITSFPGANAVIKKNKGNSVVISPDLRGGRSWFYWRFDVEVVKPGKVTFHLGAPPKLSVRGPAVSLNGGKSWKWLGKESSQLPHFPVAKGQKITGDSFSYDFKKAGERVGFCVTIPYMESNLREFINSSKDNPYCTQSVLTKTMKGRPVELIQIGKEEPGKHAVLITCRHHACESVASYVFEGFLKEAMSDTPLGKEFRRKYVLYAVPMIDKDGVQAGDQGKNRLPHDHNRDYGIKSIYPETRAIIALAEDKKIKMFLDFHDPLIRGEAHAVFAFYGVKIPHNYKNTKELSSWMGEEGPQTVGTTYVWFKKPNKQQPGQGIPMATNFVSQKGNIISATLETPYTVSACNFDADMARVYGAGVLRAWTRMDFINTGEQSPGGVGNYANLLAFRKNFRSLYMGKPEQAKAIANKYLNASKAPALYRSEANLLMGVLYLRQRKYKEAEKFFATVVKNPDASENQRSTALAQQVVIACRKVPANNEEIEEKTKIFDNSLYPSDQNKNMVYSELYKFFKREKDYGKALEFAKKCLDVTSKYNKGKMFNQVAAMQDKTGQKQQAVETREKAVVYLKKMLTPVPVGVMGATMGLDLFEALSGIPGTTEKEKQAALNICLNHKHCPAWLRQKATGLLKQQQSAGQKEKNH